MGSKTLFALVTGFVMGARVATNLVFDSQPPPSTIDLPQMFVEQIERSAETPKLLSGIPIFYNLFVGSVQDIARVETLASEQMAFWDSTYHGTVHVTSIGVP